MTYAGVELGGTKCIAILAEGPGRIVARETVATTSPDETLTALRAIIARWQADHGFAALGIGSFGPINVDPASPTYGRMRATPKPGWAHADILAPLAQAAKVPAVLDTDVNGAALAEMRWGSGRGMHDFAYITVGTGVGVGLIVNGRPTRGFGHSELGHLRVARLANDAWPGSCPFHGDCVEGLASGAALAVRLGEELASAPPDHVAWDSVTKPTFAGGDRDWAKSVGATVRFNAFGFAVGEVDRHRSSRRAGVAGDVGERFLDDAEGRCLDRGR